MEQNLTSNNIQPADPLATLTEREQAFILNYCQYRNAARAARESGYSAKTAKQIGYENLTKPYILSALSTLMEEHGMTAGECIGRLTTWARGTMEPFLNRRGELTLTSADAVDNRHLIKKVKQKKTTRTTITGEVIEELQTEIELHDAKDAVDKMLQIHGRYKQLPGDANQPDRRAERQTVLGKRSVAMNSATTNSWACYCAPSHLSVTFAPDHTAFRRRR